jgi:hypothetical protein
MSTKIDQPQKDVSDTGDTPPCYGDPERVCPRDENGIMQPQANCLSCGLLKGCLQDALRRQGLLADMFVEAPVTSKVSGFLKRWSNKKLSAKDDPGTRGCKPK